MNHSPDRSDAGALSFPEVSYEEWRRRVEAELGEADFEQTLVTRLPDGVAVEPLYAASIPAVGARRGAQASYPQRPWVTCQSFAEADLDELNQLLRAELAGGVTGVWLHLDRAARMGLDLEEASEEIGRQGSTIYHLADLETAMEGVAPDWRMWITDAGANAMPAAALLLSWLKREQIPLNGRSICLGADPLGALARDGRLPGSLKAVEGDLVTLVRYCLDSSATARAISVSSVPYREAGADSDQELGFALASAVHYLRALERHGLGPEAAAGQMVFVVAVGQDLFVEVAKLRALRALWSRVLQACGIEDPPAAWIHAAVLRRSLTRRDPWMNLLRVTAAGWAAVVGGADSVETPGFDVALAAGSTRGRRLARNTQHILRAESHLGRVVDPGGGSYYLERLTEDLGAAGWGIFQAVESEGGMLAALRAGWIRARVGERGHERRRRIESRQQPIVGVSSFADPIERSPEPAATSRQEIISQVQERLSRQSARRDRDLPQPPGPDGRLQWCVEAAAAGASVREMSRNLYGSAADLEIEPLGPRRDSEPFEVLRDVADGIAGESRRPRVYLALLTPLARVRHQVDLGRDLLRAGGFEVVVDESGELSAAEDRNEHHRRGFRDSGAAVACLCGRSEDYGAASWELARDLRDAGAVAVLAVSQRGDLARAVEEGTLDGALYDGGGAVQVLAEVLARCGKRPEVSRQ